MGCGILAVVSAPIVASALKDNVMNAVSANARCVDLGAATWPLLAGFSIGLVLLETVYGLATVLLLALLTPCAAFEWK